MNSLKKLASIGIAGMIIISCGVANGQSLEKTTNEKRQTLAMAKSVVRGKVTLPKGHDGEAFNLTIQLKPQGKTDVVYTKVIEIGDKDSYDFEFFVEEGKYDISYYDHSVKHGASKYCYGEQKGIAVNHGDSKGIDIELKRNAFFK